MFATTTQVKTITGKIVNAGLIERAQYAIEAYIGKFETEVTKTKDLEILKRAVAYQSAYMLNNEDIVFEQMAVSTTMQNDASTTFKPGDRVSPFIAPMAVMVWVVLGPGKMLQNALISSKSSLLMNPFSSTKRLLNRGKCICGPPNAKQPSQKADFRNCQRLSFPIFAGS